MTNFIYLEDEQLKEWLSILDGYIGKAFEFEESFMASFWSQGLPGDELIDFYMAPETCSISILLEWGETITTTIDTQSFINWCNSR